MEQPSQPCGLRWWICIVLGAITTASTFLVSLPASDQRWAAGIPAIAIPLGIAIVCLPLVVLAVFAYAAGVAARDPKRPLKQRAAEAAYVILAAGVLFAAAFCIYVAAFYRGKHPEWLHGPLSAAGMITIFLPPVLFAMGLGSKSRERRAEFRWAMRGMGVLFGTIAALIVGSFVVAALLESSRMR